VVPSAHLSSGLDKPVRIGDNFAVSGEMSGISRESIASIEDAIGAELLRARLLGSDPPRLANRYLVQGLLGRGATGVVVEAHDERLKRQVALKLSPLGEDNSPLVEARALASLDHPNVVRVFDVLEAEAALDGQVFRLAIVAMQLVKGFTLRAWLSREAPSQSEILRIYHAAGEGLQAAHAMHIVHRDFKPDNVLVGEDGVARVIDFGFAVNVAQIHDGDVGEVAGTGPYLAPEAKHGEQTALGDQYAFGISLAEALTGKFEIAAATPAGVSAGVWNSIRRMTSAAPADRYAGMEEALVGLRGRRTLPRAWAMLPGLMLVVLVVGGGLWWRHNAQVEVAVRHLAGTWHFDTVVEVTHSRMQVGAGGRYQMDVRYVASRSLEFRPRRLTDRLPDKLWRTVMQDEISYPRPVAGVFTRPVEVEVDGPEIRAETDVQIDRLTYHFTWFFDGDQLSCEYRAKLGGRDRYSGHCSGGRGPAPAPPPPGAP